MYVLLRSITWLLGHLPRPLALLMGRGVGWFLMFTTRQRAQIALDNLALAFPDMPTDKRKSVLKQAYMHFGMALMDFTRFPYLTPDRLPSMLEMDTTPLEEALAQNRGVIHLTGHIGFWEMVYPSLGLSGFPLVPVAVRQRGAGGQLVDWVRRSTGVKTLHKGTSSRPFVRILQNGQILTLAADQDARSQGVWVNFLSMPSSRFRGAATLHLRTGAPLVFLIYIMQKNRKYRAIFNLIPTGDLPDDQEAAIRELTQRYVTELEKHVIRHPEQYFWFHRMWKTKPR